MSINNRKLKIRLGTLRIVAFFSYELINRALSRVLGNPTVSSTICDLILLWILISALIQRKYKGKNDVLIVLVLSVLAFAITLITHPEYKDVMLNDGQWGIFRMVFVLHGGIFGYVFIRSEDSVEELIDDLKYSAIPVWACYTIKSFGGISFTSVSAISGHIILRNYNQVYGYGFLFVAIICMYHFFYKKTKWCGVLMVALGVYIILLVFF